MNESEKQSPIDRIIKRLSGTYLAQWERMIGSTPISDVKTVWAHELSGFLQSREAMQAIAWVLDNLPEKCPNVIEFKGLCRKAPALESPQIEAPKADPARVAAELAKLGPLRTAPVDRVDGRAWAHAILADVSAGVKRTPTVIQMARNVIGEAA